MVSGFSGVELALRIVVAVALAMASWPLGVNDAAAQTDLRIAVTRLHGPDRYATSVAVAERFVQESGGSIDTVVAVSGESWHEAAIGTGLAGALDAPLLLVPPDNLPPAAAEFLASSGVSKVIAIGASDVLPNAVLGRIARFASVERIWRSDPIATSIAVAKRIGTPGSTLSSIGRSPTVVLANVESLANVDGLATFAAQGPHPVLFTSPASLDERVKSYIMASGVQYYLSLFDDEDDFVGWSDAVADELLGLDVFGARQWAWDSRLHHLGVHSESQIERCVGSSAAGLVTAPVPFDSFSAGPLMAKLCAPTYSIHVHFLLSDWDFDIVTDDLASTFRDGIDSLFVIGGEAAVPSRTLSFIDAYDNRQSFFRKAAAQRAKISATLTWRINADAYGVDDNNVLRGPAGFRIDLDDCPADWSDGVGITQDEIRIGVLLPKSGLLSHHGLIEEGMQNYLDWVNEHDPVADRQIVLVSRDSADDPAQAAHYPAQNLDPLVSSLIEDGEVFSVMTLTYATTLGAYERLGDECIPQPFAAGGHAATGDPVHHPWFTGMTMSHTTAARLWGEWIAQKFSRVLPVKVAALVSDDDYSRSYQQAFESWAASRPEVISDFAALRPEPDAVGLDDEMAEIAAFGPDAFVLMTGRYAWSWVIPSIHRSGLAADIESKDGVFIAASRPLLDELWAFDNWWTIGPTFKDADDPSFQEEPFVAFMRENLYFNRGTTGYWAYFTGYQYMYPYVEALRIAATLPGGLTRTNFILAVRSLDITHPLVVDGVRFAMNGNDDAYFVEGARFQQVDAESRSLIPVEPVIDINGQTPNCAWDRASSRCQ